MVAHVRAAFGLFDAIYEGGVLGCLHLYVTGCSDTNRPYAEGAGRMKGTMIPHRKTMFCMRKN